MSTRDGYLYYLAGQAVAAAHLGLPIRQVSADLVQLPTAIDLPRDGHKQQIILWLTGMAAEKKGVGRSDPLRRTRNRQRIRSQVEAAVRGLPAPRRAAQGEVIVGQAQDRANAICNELLEAIHQVAGLLREGQVVSREQVEQFVAEVKARRYRESKAMEEQAPAETAPAAPPTPAM